MSRLVSVQALQEEMKGGLRPQLVDVRTAAEFAAGHIPCAINVPMDQFESRRPDLRPEDGVVLICTGGSRAQIVAGWLQPQHVNGVPGQPAVGLTGWSNARAAGGHGAVRVLKGGTDAWQRDGLELVRSAKTRWSLERQARLGAGLMIVSATLSVAAGIHWGTWLAMAVGAGLTLAGFSDRCLLSTFLARMPWNQAKPSCAGPKL